MDDFLVSDDPFEVYLHEVSKIPPMSPEQEAACIQHVRAGDQEAERSGKDLVEANLAMVVSIAQRNSNDRIYILDLIIEGNNGLMRALKTFCDSHEENFSAHATPHIERAIAEALAASGSTGGLK
jgi:RNA polymerase primary sigma factor